MASIAEWETREQAWSRCVQQMDALADEMRQAIGAIANNALISLEQSVRRQGEQSASLRWTLSHLRARGHSPTASPQLDSRFHKATQTLCSLNKEYAALLHHSGESLRMLRALDGQSSMQETGVAFAHGSGERHQSWSWEG